MAIKLRNLLYLLFLAFISVHCIVGCGSGGGGTGGSGGSSAVNAQGAEASRIVITFQNPGFQRKFLHFGTKQNKELPTSTKTIVVKLMNVSTGQQVQGDKTIEFTASQPTASTSFENVIAGAYEILVAAHDSASVLVGEGKSPVMLEASTVQTVTVVVTPVTPPVSPPVISSITPVSGPPGTTVSILGANFGALQGSGTVAFGGGTAGTVTSWSDTAITAVVPTGAVTGNISVTVQSGLSAAGPQFAVLPPKFEGEIVAVCNEADSTLSLIDSKTDAVLKTMIFDGSAIAVVPHCVDFTPSGNKMVLTNPTGKTVQITPTAAFTATSSKIIYNGTAVRLTEAPYEVTMRPNTSGDGKGYVTCNTNQWGVVDTLNNTGGLVTPGLPDIFDTVTLVSPRITYAAFDSTGTNAYLVGNDTDRIAFTVVVERASNTILSKNIVYDESIVGGLKLENIMAAVMPDNGRLYTIAGTFNPLIGGIAYYTPLPSISYSFQQKVIVGSMPAGMTILPDGSRIYVANSDSNNVSVIDPATNTVLKTIEGFSTPVQAASHPNGKKVYITNKSGNSVSVIDTATDTVIKVIPVGQTPFGISVAPKIL